MKRRRVLGEFSVMPWVERAGRELGPAGWPLTISGSIPDGG